MPQALEPAIPTYKAAAALLERSTGSGIKMAGWTVARTLLIAPPMMVVGVAPRTAFLGAGLASIMITGFAILKIYNAGDGLGRVSPARCPCPRRHLLHPREQRAWPGQRRSRSH